MDFTHNVWCVSSIVFLLSMLMDFGRKIWAKVAVRRSHGLLKIPCKQELWLCSSDDGWGQMNLGTWFSFFQSMSDQLCCINYSIDVLIERSWLLVLGICMPGEFVSLVRIWGFAWGQGVTIAMEIRPYPGETMINSWEPAQLCTLPCIHVITFLDSTAPNRLETNAEWCFFMFDWCWNVSHTWLNLFWHSIDV